MSDTPTLLYLHGVGTGDQENAWRASLDASLAAIGYPTLEGVKVIAPRYPFGLRGVDDEVPLPKLSVPTLRGDAAARYRLEFQGRRTAMAAILGSDDTAGAEVLRVDPLVPTLVKASKLVQANNYLTDPKVRAWVLQRVLDAVQGPQRLVIVAHSLGSVIAADLLRRLPPSIEVMGMVTIGSPLGFETFHVDGLRTELKAPSPNLRWWVNFWNALDPVARHRGVSAVFPWVLDHRIALLNRQVHDAATYLSNEKVATAVAVGLFGSKSRELVRVPHGHAEELDIAETLALLGLRLAHLTLRELSGDTRMRYAAALRQVQAETVQQVRRRNDTIGRPTPAAIAELEVDLSEPDSPTPVPSTPRRTPMSESAAMMVALATANLLRPFEIEVPKATQAECLTTLANEMGLGAAFGADAVAEVERARKALADPVNRTRMIVVGLGIAALVAATGGLALAATPGLAGAAAVTSALAAFGPGGMIGGLLTAGTLITAGGGSIAVGLAGVGTSAASVEAVVITQLAAALLREKQNIEQDPQTWAGFTQLEMEIAKELARLEAVSDDDAKSLKELRRKLTTVQRAIACLQSENLGYEPPVSLDVEG